MIADEDSEVAETIYTSENVDCDILWPKMIAGNIDYTVPTMPNFNFSVSLKFVTASYIIFSLSIVQAMEIFMIT